MHRLRLGTGVAAGAVALVLAAAPAPAMGGPAAATGHYLQHNLVADRPGRAATTDPHLVNPWGLSAGPSTPLWVSDNGTGLSTVYSGSSAATISTVPLVVTIPGGAPTGQVFNDTNQFVVPGTGSPAAFVFAGEDGYLSAWNAGTAAVLVAHPADAVYKGLALVHTGGGARLLAANFRAGRVDVFSSAFRLLRATNAFRDPRLPRGYAPFNVAVIGHRVFVAYALQDAARHDDVAGAGHGFLDTFTLRGAFLHRFASRGDLDSPWGLTIAPAAFGRFSRDLLVGNFGDGRIHAYDPATGRELGTLRRPDGRPVVIAGLWGLLAGNPTAGGTKSVWFSAGSDHEAHGLLGTLTAQ